jgi:hypothetical protein
MSHQCPASHLYLNKMRKQQQQKQVRKKNLSREWGKVGKWVQVTYSTNSSILLVSTVTTFNDHSLAISKAPEGRNLNAFTTSKW